MEIRTTRNRTHLSAPSKICNGKTPAIRDLSVSRTVCIMILQDLTAFCGLSLPLVALEHWSSILEKVHSCDHSQSLPAISSSDQRESSDFKFRKAFQTFWERVKNVTWMMKRSTFKMMPGNDRFPTETEAFGCFKFEKVRIRRNQPHHERQYECHVGSNSGRKKSCAGAWSASSTRHRP